MQDDESRASRKRLAISALVVALSLSLANLALTVVPSPADGTTTDRVVDHDETWLTANETTIRIQYKMVPGRASFPNAFESRYMCRLKNRPPLPATLATLLPYRTKLDSELNVVVMGDSVGMQIAGAYQRASGEGTNHRRQTLIEERSHEILTHAALENGHHIFGWRITDLWLRKNQGLPLRHRKKNGGWNLDQVECIHNRTNTIDALIFRIPQGWIDMNEVSMSSLNETVHLAQELLSVRCVTFLTLPVVNNYLTVEDMKEMNRTNDRIHRFANEWNTRRRGDHLPLVLVLEFGELVNAAGEANAEFLKLNAVSTERVFVQDRVGSGEWTKPAALTCADRPTNTTPSSCTRNHLSVDGVHVCMETFSGRMFAAIACQLACVFNSRKGETRTTQSTIECTVQCNRRYMRLRALRNETLGQFIK